MMRMVEDQVILGGDQMLVRAVDDINLKVISDPEGRYKNWHILFPNSVRRDFPFSFTRSNELMGRRRFGGKELRGSDDRSY
jgi:hypothetical protein